MSILSKLFLGSVSRTATFICRITEFNPLTTSSQVHNGSRFLKGSSMRKTTEIHTMTEDGHIMAQITHTFHRMTPDSLLDNPTALIVFGVLTGIVICLIFSYMIKEWPFRSGQQYERRHGRQRGRQHGRQHGQQHGQQHEQHHEQQHGQQHEQHHEQQHEQQHGQQDGQQQHQEGERAASAPEEPRGRRMTNLLSTQRSKTSSRTASISPEIPHSPTVLSIASTSLSTAEPPTPPSQPSTSTPQEPNPATAPVTPASQREGRRGRGRPRRTR